jgi:hypothetical protein
MSGADPDKRLSKGASVGGLVHFECRHWHFSDQLARSDDVRSSG